MSDNDKFCCGHLRERIDELTAELSAAESLLREMPPVEFTFANSPDYEPAMRTWMDKCREFRAHRRA